MPVSMPVIKHLSTFLEEHFMNHTQKLFDLFAPLASPETAGNKTPGLLAETLLSLIFGVRLDGQDVVLKVAKPIDIGVADYTTLVKRYENLEKELHRNMDFAPQLYLGLVPICEDDNGNYTLDVCGKPIEWALKMRCFNQEDMFSKKLEAGTLSDELLVQFVDKIAAYHRGTPAVDTAIFNLDVYIQDNIRKIEGLNIECADTLDLYKQEWSKVQNLLAKRKPKACHGDLHLENITLLDGEPIAFDALAFNDDLFHVDSFYDFSFFLMDMLVRGEQAKANLCLNRYLEQTGDYAGVPMLRLFLSHLALVRAKVTMLKVRDASVEQQQLAAKSAQKYLDFAHHTLSFNHPTMLAVGGLSGSGKSTLAKGLAGELFNGFTIMLRSDVLRKQMLGLTPQQKAPASAYTAEMHVKTAEFLQQKAAIILAAGFPVLIDATHQESRARQSIAHFATIQKVLFTAIWCDVPQNVAESRISKRSAEGTDASDAGIDVYRMQLQNFSLADVKADGWEILNADGAPEEVLSRAKKLFTD